MAQKTKGRSLFSRGVTDADGSLTQIALTADSLTLAGATVVSAASGLAAELAHDGTAATEPARARAALTAGFESVPDEHDGSSPIVFSFAFSEKPATVTYQSMRTETLVMHLGRERILWGSAERPEKPSKRRWQVWFSPLSSPKGIRKGDLTVEIAPRDSCEDAGAVCTADGRLLSNTLSHVIKGPPGLSVAGAPEAAGATLDFVVTLSRAAADTVTVDYATSDGPAPNGATASEDYTAATGTLTFEPGETSKTVSVALLDDADDEETVTLTLSNASGNNAWLSAAKATGTINNDDPAAVLTASFLNVPEAHDASPFTFELEFSETLKYGVSYKTLGGDNGQPSVLSVSGGRVTGARRLLQGENRNKKWEITVAPDGNSDVTVTLPAPTDCAAPDAICTEDNRPLSAAVSGTVPGPPPSDTPVELTVRFEAGPPATHDGTSAFTFRIAFSEEPHALGYQTVRDQTLNIWQGQSINASNARRLVQGSNLRWEITVTPISTADITVGLGPTADCGDSGAVCTEDGRMLANQIHAVIQGPAALSVADAEATEGTDANMAFQVTLDRAALRTITVDYETQDGTATAGADYTATSGTLTFTVGQRSKTVQVPILDDSHDDDGETFTLALSNASGARIEDGEATGTIENSDPIPRAFMARFGRTAAVHVVEQVQERMEAPREVGFEAQFAGRQLRPDMVCEMAVGYCQVNRNSLIFAAISILASTKNQRLSWHVNQWNLQEIS